MTTQQAVESFSFTLQGPPQPKQRARAGRGGRFYTPLETRAYEKAIKRVASLTAGSSWGRGGIYRVHVHAVFANNHPRDLDNLVKSVLDGMNGVAWHDDRQVFETSARKSVDAANPRTEVRVERAGDYVRPKSRRRKAG